MKKGFTLIEVFIVLCIVGLLAAIAIPAFIKAKKDMAEKQKIELSNSGDISVNIVPKISLKTTLEIIAIGAIAEFAVYKLIDYEDHKKFYIVVSSNSTQKISLERSE